MKSTNPYILLIRVNSPPRAALHSFLSQFHEYNVYSDKANKLALFPPDEYHSSYRFFLCSLSVERVVLPNPSAMPVQSRQKWKKSMPPTPTMLGISMTAIPVSMVLEHWRRLRRTVAMAGYNCGAESRSFFVDQITMSDKAVSPRSFLLILCK